ncbi:sine oculis-binding protein homolog A [Synchiropus picturatus]
MAETEKEGRPPENKRSRKPAHPVKREINEEMKSFAENTMNELLGWYGYDKVELRDSDSLDVAEAAQHISALKEHLGPKEGGEAALDGVGAALCVPAPRNGVTECCSAPSTSAPGNPTTVVPMVPPPLIKGPADEDGSNVQIVCAWCQKVGVKRYSLSMGSELKSFCSEKCFAACRRAYFKRNKVCDWCKHIRHTKEYLDFGAGERRLQFCSAKCLNQYKMDIFYKETQAALCNPAAGADATAECSGGVQLLTPESWGTPLAELRRKAPSPLGPSSAAPLAACSAASPPLTVCSPSSSVSAKIPTPRPHDSPSLPPPPIHPSTLHPTSGVPSGSPPMVMTPRGPMPLPLFMEHQMMQQIRPTFLRPPHHPGGPNSPLPNPIIPGIGPPPPRNHASSPMHRPMISPHVHPSSNPNPGLMPPHPGLSVPGLPPFPPVNMLPNGPIPFSPMMNFGLPSLAPLVPPPSLLVPYPVIVPLPVPIPIPIPIPLSPESLKDKLDSRGSKHSAAESSEPTVGGLLSPNLSGGHKRDGKLAERLSPGCSQTSRSVVTKVKAEESLGSTCQSSGSGQADGVIDLTVGQRLDQQQLAQRMLLGVQVKLEADSESRSPPAAREKVRLRGEETTEPAGSKQSQTQDAPADAEPPSNSLTPPPSANVALTRPECPGQQLQPSPAAPCHVIVNGAGRRCSEPTGAGAESEGRSRGQPVNADLEQEALKENTCARRLEKSELWDCGKRGAVQDQMREAVVGKQEPESLEEGEHAYALPLLSTGSCVVLQPAAKPGILSRAIAAPLSAAESSELEPALKRRCLRIRNQNK